MSQAYYRKWRPQQWEEVIGQDHVIQTIKNAIISNRIAHAYLFAGPRGTGKTTTARLLAKAINCTDNDLAKRPCNECDCCKAVNEGRFLDLIEIDAASNTSVEDVRDLRDKINFSPSLGSHKVYIIDEVHMLSTAAFNALLKTLEEPPAHAIFILATTEVHKIPATVLSRCQRHEFRRIPVPDIITFLRTKANEESLSVEVDTLTLIARQATGSLRDAISLLDQLASMGQMLTLEMAQTVLGTATSQAVMNLVEAIRIKNSAEGLKQIQQALDAGTDPRQFARQMVEYLRNLLLVQMENASSIDVPVEVRTQMGQHAQAFTRSDLLRIIRGFNDAAVDLRSGWQASLPLELAFAEALEQDVNSQIESSSAQPVLAKPEVHNRIQIQNEKLPEAVSVSFPTQPAAMPVAEKEISLEASENNVVNPTTTQATVSLQVITQNWQRILKAVREQNPKTYGLLNSYRSMELVKNVLHLGFASEVLKNQIEKKENSEIIRSALLQVLGLDIPVRYSITNTKSDIPSDIDSDGMVATALRIGGEIANVKKTEK
jgi:DNA polymerase-3 subunit gamma/tau